jgi:hypothetical protein
MLGRKEQKGLASQVLSFPLPSERPAVHSPGVSDMCVQLSEYAVQVRGPLVCSTFASTYCTGTGREACVAARFLGICCGMFFPACRHGELKAKKFSVGSFQPLRSVH